MAMNLACGLGRLELSGTGLESTGGLGWEWNGMEWDYFPPKTDLKSI
jgi:hypothetical protein